MSQAPGISSGLWNFVDIVKIRKFVQFRTILGLILGPFWDSSWAHFGLILATEMGPLRGGHMSGNTRNSKVFGSGLAPSGVPFWATFGIPFGLILGPILDPFWDKFWVQLWAGFGSHLGVDQSHFVNLISHSN